jgi:MFS family permease
MIGRVFPILAVSIFSCMLGSGIVVPLLPLYAESLGASSLWIGVIFASYPIARVLATPIVGRISDRKGRKPFISIGLLAYGAISFAFMATTLAPQLALLRLLHGVAGAMILPIAMAYVGDICPPGEEGKWMGYANAAFAGGFGFGPLIGGVLGEQVGINAAFIAMGSLSLVAFFIAVLFLPETTRRQSASALPPLRDISRSSMMNGLLALRLTMSMGTAAFFTFLPILVSDNLGLSASLIGTLLATNMLLSSLLTIPLGRIADRWNRRLLVIGGSLVTSMFLFAMPLGQDFGVLLVIAVLGSLGSATTVPAASAMIVQVGRQYGMGSSIALFSMAQSIGMVIGPMVSGAVADRAGVNSAFYCGAGIALVGASLFAWLTRRQQPVGAALE